MPELSVPFINTLLLALLGIRLGLRHRRNLSDVRRVLVFIAACALCTLLVGLRWRGGEALAAHCQPLAASLLPVICWRCFQPGRANTRALPGFNYAHYVHLLPPAMVGVVMIGGNALPWPLLDITLWAIYLGYGLALLFPWLRHPALRKGRSADGAIGQQAAAGGILLLCGSLDALVALDFALGQGKHAVYLVACANLLLLLALAAVITRAGVGAPEITAPSGNAAVPGPTPDADDLQRAGRFDRLMREERLFAIPDLDIITLARRLGLPVRQLSAAINLVHGRNISQIVNEYRINEAARLLGTTDGRITDIMFASGFQTKSNFNREFRRVTGVNPSEYRNTVRTRVQPGQPPDISAIPQPENPG